MPCCGAGAVFYWSAPACSCVKHDLKVIYKGNCGPKKTFLVLKTTNFSVWSRSRVEPPFFAWSRSMSLNRSNLVGAVVGSVTSDSRSRSRPKKWRLRNTAEEQSLAIVSYRAGYPWTLFSEPDPAFFPNVELDPALQNCSVTSNSNL